MPSAWIWGTLFLVFIGGFILYVLSVDTPSSKEARENVPAAPSPPDVDPVMETGKYRIARNYQVVLSTQAFVNYPFGLRVILPTEPPESRPQARRDFQESDYHSWPQAVGDDPQLVVKSGRIEFDAEEAEPPIKVELQFAREAFEMIQTSEEQVLWQDRDVVYSFWLNPLTAQEHLLAAAISRVTAREETARSELATIPLAVSVTHFPIRLR